MVKEGKIEKKSETLEEKIEKFIETGGNLDGDGQVLFQLHYPEGKDEKTSPIAIVEHEKKIAYAGAGISCYQGLHFFNGDKLLDIKPLLKWRDGKNQKEDRPENLWHVEEFIEKDDDSHELVIGSSAQDIEIYRLEKNDVSFQKRMTEVEYKEQKQDKTPMEKLDLLETRLRKITLESNRRGGGGTWDTFCLKTNTGDLEEFENSFSDEKKLEKQVTEAFQLNYPLIFNASESLKGFPLRFRVFTADPKTLELKEVFHKEADKDGWDSVRVEKIDKEDKDEKSEKIKKMKIIYRYNTKEEPGYVTPAESKTIVDL